MPQETDATTGNQLVQQDGRADPQPLIHHRSGITAADGTARPAPSNGGFAQNPGYRRTARVFVVTSGSPTTCILRPYLRSGGAAGQVSTGPLVYLSGTPNYDAGFDITTDGDDLLLFVEQLAGGTSPTVDVWLSWR